MATSNPIIQTKAECPAKQGQHKCRMPATHKASWGSTFCDDCYDKLKDLITRNESPEYDWHICARPGCGRRSHNTTHNVAYPRNEVWLCEKLWRNARLTTMVQEETGGWSLCNFCHAPLDLLVCFAKDAGGKYILPYVHDMHGKYFM